MNTMTLADAENRFGVQVDEHHDRQLDIPVLTGLQAQGDVMIVPVAHILPGALTDATLVPAHGVAVVRGENGGNTHLLLGAGPVHWVPSAAAGVDPDDLDLGMLTVPAGSTAYLAHPEHAYTGVGEGSYTLRRQREQAAAARFVED